MICPKCKGEPRQIGSTARPECVLMRWECNKCHHRYTTVEQIADSAAGYTCLSCSFFAHDANFCTRHGKSTYVKSNICENFAKKQINPVMNYGVYSLICEELAKAKEKHPIFAENIDRGGMIISEEYAEFTDAVRKLFQGINDRESNDNLIEEAAHVAVTAIRFIEERLK